MLTPLLLLWPATLVLTWLVAQGIANKPFDRALEYNVQALAQLVAVQNGRVQVNLPAPAREILRADDADPIHIASLLAASPRRPGGPITLRACARSSVDRAADF